jgi:hypothetical protein
VELGLRSGLTFKCALVSGSSRNRSVTVSD